MESNEIGLLLAKIEGTYGTDPTPANSANLIPVLRDSVNLRAAAEPVGRKHLNGGIAPTRGFNTLPTWEITFSYELRGNRTDGSTADISSGSASNLLEIDCLLKACGLAPTYTAETSGGARDGFVTYVSSFPTATEGDSVTIYWQAAKKLHKLTGCKGSFRLRGEAGKPMFVDFTFRGLYVAPTDVDLSTTSAAWVETRPPLVQGSTCTIAKASGNHSPILSSFEFDLGNEIVRRDDITASTGVKGFLIADLAPKARLNPEAVTEASNPFWADWAASEARLVTIGTGADSGNRFQLTFTGEYKDVNYLNRNKFRHHDVQMDVVKPLIASTNATWFALKFS